MNKTLIMITASAVVLMAGCRRRGGEQSAGCEPGKEGVANGEGRSMRLIEHRSGEWSPGLEDKEKQTLFEIAQDTLAWCVKGGVGVFDFSGYPITPRLREPMATFVTLKERGQLRGCIGSLAPVEELYRSVHHNAVNAALRDTRFRPVAPAELHEIEIHISVLSPIADIPAPDAFKIGEHGIILEKGAYRAVYLPEVAPEQGWTVEQTLSSLSRKAGLHADAWRQGARFKVFSSVVIEKAPDAGDPGRLR